MKNLLIIISIFTIVNIALAQGEFTPPTTYFETSSIPISMLNPNFASGSAVISFFDLSQINTAKPDIAISENMQQLLGGSTYQFTKYGNWNSNNGSGNFATTQSSTAFFPQEYLIGEPQADANRFTATTFIKLRNDDKKDFVALRKNNIYVFKNDLGTLSGAIQNISNGGTYMDVGNFTSGDNYDDIAIVNGGVFIYRNDLTGTLSLLNPQIDYIPAKKCKLGQINDKTHPYPQNNPSDKADIITIRNFEQHFYIYLNTNSNNINLSQQIDAGFIINDLEVADINRDGYNDVIVLGGSTQVKIFLNNGSGTISNTPVYTNSLPISTNPLLAISDINNDGFNDLVVVRNEGYTDVFINSGSGSYFPQTPNQSITNLVGLQSTNSQIKVMDIYNTGGKALFISWNGAGPTTSANWGVSRVNAVCFNWPPPPPLISASIHKDGTYNRPKIKIISNFETNDFLKYEIYKSNAASGWNFNYCGQTTTNEFIDNTEYVLYTGNGDAPPPNCIYAVKTVDSTNFRSNLSNELGYRVGDPICPTCGVEGMEGSGDNSFVNSTPESELNLTAPSEYSISSFPNPFNPVTKIYYNLPIQGNVKIEIYNSKGQMIKELVNEFKFEGNYVADFDGSNLSSGVYFYKIQTNKFSQTKRMILLK